MCYSHENCDLKDIIEDREAVDDAAYNILATQPLKVTCPLCNEIILETVVDDHMREHDEFGFGNEDNDDGNEDIVGDYNNGYGDEDEDEDDEGEDAYMGEVHNEDYNNEYDDEDGSDEDNDDEDANIGESNEGYHSEDEEDDYEEYAENEETNIEEDSNDDGNDEDSDNEEVADDVKVEVDNSPYNRQGGNMVQRVMRTVNRLKSMRSGFFL